MSEQITDLDLSVVSSEKGTNGGKKQTSRGSRAFLSRRAASEENSQTLLESVHGQAGPKCQNFRFLLPRLASAALSDRRKEKENAIISH